MLKLLYLTDRSFKNGILFDGLMTERLIKNRYAKNATAI